MCAAMTTAVRKGENVTLSALADDLGSVSVILEWSVEEDLPLDADVSVLLLGGDGKVRSNDDLIFYNQPSGASGAVRLRGKNSSPEGDVTTFTAVVDIDMDDVPDSVGRVLLAASLDVDSGLQFGQMKDLRVRILRGGDAAELLRFDVLDASTETAFVLGEVYRRSGQWKFRAVGQGYDTGLATLVTEYGVDVDEAEAPTMDEGTASAAPEAAAETAASTLVDSAPPAEQPAKTPSRAPSGARERGTPKVSTRKRDIVRRLPTPRRATSPAEGTDQAWQPARLFPVAGIGGGAEQERRATSALLATMATVRDLGRALVTRFGAPAGRIETFIEVPFNRGDEPYIPDGLIRVTRGQRVWTALVEVKTGDGELRQDQVEAYLDIAREQQFDAVITISNLVTVPDERHPTPIDGRKTKKVGVHHLSWADIRFRCQHLLANDLVSDATQKHVLREFLRYLDHPRSGGQTFEDMGRYWVPVRDSLTAGTLRPTDKGLPAVAERFDQFAHYLCIHVGGLLGVEVTPHTSRQVDAAQRRQLLAEELCATGSMSAALRIPGTVGPVTLTADLRAGRIVCSTSIAAPRQGRPLTRVKWIMRQLGDANGNLRIESFERGSRDAARAELLALVRQKPEVLIADAGKDIRMFRVSLSAPLGTKRQVGRGTFITSVTETLEKFYQEVVQNLREWRESTDTPTARDPAPTARS